MCGIAGYIGQRTLDRSVLRRCLAVLNHRGPDGSGMYARRFSDKSNVHLLHTRLSIIDLDERSAQPMERGDDALVFNGEIYNYLEARRDLERSGIPFSTQGDAEVLLNTLRAKGTGGLDSLEGMWGFAWHDGQSGKLTLCRDRFGEKPLFIHRTSHGLYFASEIKGLAALLGHDFPVDYNYLDQYLRRGYKHLFKDNRTYFQGVEELGPGTMLTISPDGTTAHARYWAPQVAVDGGLGFGDAVAGVREAIIRSVEIRLRSDVPLAFCMSGGVDSNAIISVASRELGHDVTGFTIIEEDERYAEGEQVKLSVAELGIDHVPVPVDRSGFLDNLRALVKAHDGPLCTISYYAHWMLVKAMAEQGFKVSFSGTGADEIFTGYYDHHLLYLAEVADTPAVLERSTAAWREHVAPIVRNPHLQNPRLFIDNPGFREHLDTSKEGMARFLLQGDDTPFHEEAYHESLLRNRMLNELFHEVVPPILREDDLNSMSVSIENRSPFLDRGIFEAAYSAPGRHLVRDGRAKALLREAMAGIVPEPIRTCRRKVGFNASLHSFLDTRDPAVQATLMADSPVFEMVDRNAMGELLDKERLSNTESKFLFSFLGAKFFLDEQEGCHA